MQRGKRAGKTIGIRVANEKNIGAGGKKQAGPLPSQRPCCCYRPRADYTRRCGASSRKPRPGSAHLVALRHVDHPNLPCPRPGQRLAGGRQVLLLRDQRAEPEVLGGKTPALLSIMAAKTPPRPSHQSLDSGPPKLGARGPWSTALTPDSLPRVAQLCARPCSRLRQRGVEPGCTGVRAKCPSAQGCREDMSRVAPDDGTRSGCSRPLLAASRAAALTDTGSMSDPTKRQPYSRAPSRG